MGASAMTLETRAGGVLAKTGHKVAFFYVAHAEDTRGERLFDPELTFSKEKNLNPPGQRPHFRPQLRRSIIFRPGLRPNSKHHDFITRIRILEPCAFMFFHFLSFSEMYCHFLSFS